MTKICNHENLVCTWPTCSGLKNVMKKPIFKISLAKNSLLTASHHFTEASRPHTCISSAHSKCARRVLVKICNRNSRFNFSNWYLIRNEIDDNCIKRSPWQKWHAAFKSSSLVIMWENSWRYPTQPPGCVTGVNKRLPRNCLTKMFSSI